MAFYGILQRLVNLEAIYGARLPGYAHPFASFINQHHFAAFMEENECWGVVIVSKKLEISIAIEEIILIWAASQAEEYLNSIRQLPV